MLGLANMSGTWDFGTPCEPALWSCSNFDKLCSCCMQQSNQCMGEPITLFSRVIMLGGAMNMLYKVLESCLTDFCQ